MWELIRKIISRREGEVTVVVIDDQDPDHSGSFRVRSSDIVKLTLLLVLISVAVTTILFFITPLGSYYSQQSDRGLRQEVLAISEKVIALQDSLDARDRQLTDLKGILISVPDTVFQTRSRSGERPGAVRAGQDPLFMPAVMPAYEMLSSSDILFSDVLGRAPMFPAPWPVEGTLTQGFSREQKHYGIDIAARRLADFQAIADGTVISADWSINYGHIMQIQHGDGYVSVYKHAASLFRDVGDIVMEGDLLGTVGDQGALSFGSHLHLELWKNGVAQDPQMYLIK